MSTTAGLVVGAGAAALAFLRLRKNAAHGGVLVDRGALKYAHLNVHVLLVQVRPEATPGRYRCSCQKLCFSRAHYSSLTSLRTLALSLAPSLPTPSSYLAHPSYCAPSHTSSRLPARLRD